MKQSWLGICRPECVEYTVQCVKWSLWMEICGPVCVEWYLRRRVVGWEYEDQNVRI